MPKSVTTNRRAGKKMILPWTAVALLTLAPYLQLISHHYTSRHGLPPGPISAIHADSGSVYCAAGKEIYRLEGNRWRQLANPPVTYEDIIPKLPVNMIFPKLMHPGQSISSLEARPQCMATDASGHLWIGTNRNILVLRGDDYVFAIEPGPGGLPYPDVTTIACDATTGWVWVGFSEGAAVLAEGKWRYFWGRRWLPGNRVYQVVSDGSGGAWFATDHGVARFEARRMRLQDKAAHYEAINAARHNRSGFTTDCRLADPEDFSSFRHLASDNDGLWTALTIAAESFRFAVTRDSEARELARKSMRALLELVYKTGAPGFPARAIARRDEPHVALSDFSSDRWKTSPEAGWLYKTDTSSDEIDGHYFAWYIYSELVADERERAEIREICRAVTNRILDDNLLLLRPDGRRTTWGVWAPEYLNDDPNWWQERALNSMEILSHLQVAIRLCGDQRFTEKYEELIGEHHYLLNAAEGRVVDPSSAINHSDDELWFLAYYPMIMLENHPSRRQLLRLSLERSWRTLRPERSPLYNFIYSVAGGNPADPEEAVETLQRWPWDLRNWTTRNSHRRDLLIASTRNRFGRLISTTPLPPDERDGLKWNHDPYQFDGGNDGKSEYDAAAFLLPYWLGRYHRLIAEAP